MLRNLVIRKGIIHGQAVVLESSSGLPDGQAVLVALAVPEGGDEQSESAKEELVQKLEAEEALQTINRMRHTGRSIREL